MARVALLVPVKWFTKSVVLLLLALVFFMKIQTALVMIFCGFAVNSFLKWLYFRVPISRLIAKLRHKVSRNNDNLVPAVQHSASMAIDQATIDEQDDSTGKPVHK